MQATPAAMGRVFLPGLRAGGHLLACLPQLDGREVLAADGHAMEHAINDRRNHKGAHRPFHFIYKLEQAKGQENYGCAVRRQFGP